MEALFRTRTIVEHTWYGRTWVCWLAWEFKLGHLWRGAYVNVRELYQGTSRVEVWVCLLPCMPIHFGVSWG